MRTLFKRDNPLGGASKLVKTQFVQFYSEEIFESICENTRENYFFAMRRLQ